MSHHRLIHCTFPQTLIREPLLYNLGKDFRVVPNIKGATISEEVGKVYLDLEGPEEEIERAVEFLKERGVEVQEVPGGMPTGTPTGTPPPAP